MNWIKFNPETKAIDLSVVFTSEQENMVSIDGFDTTLLKPLLQAKEIDDLEKPTLSGYEKKTIWILEEDESLRLPKAKDKKLIEFSAESLMKSKFVIPEYKQMNALFGIYNETVRAQYADTMLAFRIEFYRLKSLVDACETVEAVNAIESNFPSTLV